jgi:hypothetical protein
MVFFPVVPHFLLGAKTAMMYPDCMSFLSNKQNSYRSAELPMEVVVF